MKSGRTIAFLELFLSAELQESDYGYDTLAVLMSPLVAPTDRAYQPIDALLSSRCTALIEFTTVEDKWMMFGEAHQASYRVFHKCPGDVPHVCNEQRLEEKSGELSVSIAG